MELKNKIDDQISTLHDLVNEIKALDVVIEKTENLQIRDEYLEYLLETVEDYKIICKNLRIDLNTYFNYEKDSLVPVQFNFHRLAKALDSIKV